jgi:hypothetical protein
MIRKTYGVSGLMDWTTQIKVGKAAISFHFTGGALTAYGVTPAQYSTANPIYQNVIEGSEYYKNGRIKLLGQMEVADDAAAIARKSRAPKVEQPKPAETANTGGSSAENIVEGGSEEGAESDGAVNTTLLVEVADKPAAIEYLKENFADKNYTATKLRTETAFQQACKECGVSFEFSA